MKRQMVFILLNTVLVLAACSKGTDLPPVSRDALLPAAKVTPLFAGNTLEVIRPSDNTRFKVVFTKKGGVISLAGAGKRKGTWKVKDDGKHCLQWESKPEQCRHVASDGKGKYMLVDDNLKPIWVIDSIESAKADTQ